MITRKPLNWIGLALCVALAAMSGCGKKKTTDSTSVSVVQDPALTTENANLRAQNDTLQQQIADLDNQIQLKDGEIARWKEKYNGAMASAGSNSASQGDLAELQNKIKTLEGIIAKRDSEGNLVLVLENKVFFKSGSAELNDGAKQSLLTVAKILNNDYAGNKISVDGHADSDPIKMSKYKTNWELSSARSLEVLHFLADNGRVTENRMASRSFSFYAPVAKNDSAANKAKNRRVEIVILNN